MRFGSRKPSVPNNPTTLDGWRELEKSFEPCSLLDEIHLVRLQLEYYAAADGEATSTALDALVSWLDSLPSPQRVAFLGLLGHKSALISNAAALKEKNLALIKTLEERFGRLDHSYCSFQ